MEHSISSKHAENTVKNLSLPQVLRSMGQAKPTLWMKVILWMLSRLMLLVKLLATAYVRRISTPTEWTLPSSEISTHSDLIKTMAKKVNHMELLLESSQRQLLKIGRLQYLVMENKDGTTYISPMHSEDMIWPNDIPVC